MNDSFGPDRAGYDLTVLPAGLHCTVQTGTSLLDAAEAAGIALPSSCRNGTCRTCLCRLRAGTVSYRVKWPGLSIEEKGEGWVLPCVAEAHSHVVIESPSVQRLTTGPRTLSK